MTKLHWTEELGTMALIFSSGITFLVVTFTPLLLGVKSRELAGLLHDLSRVEGVISPPTRRWYCRPMTVVFLASVMLVTVFMTYYTTTWGFREFIEISALSFSCAVYMMNYFLPGLLFSMVFGLIGRSLEAATETAVTTVSTILVHDDSLKSESQVQAAVMALRDLDVIIRKVGS